MKKYWIAALIAALLLCGACAEELSWYPRTLTAPETELQQALYNFALDQAEVMKRNLKRTSDNRIEFEQDVLSENLFAFLQNPDETFSRPVNVVIMTPTESFGEGGSVQLEYANTPQDFSRELWSSAGMRAAHYTNLFNGNMYQVEYLDSMAIHSAQDFPAGSGMAYALCIYGEGMPQIGVSVLLGEDGAAVCRTDLIYFEQIAEYAPEFLTTAINYWGDAAFETVYIK